MNLYEKVIILNPNLEDSAADETVKKIKDIIINKGGEILKTDNWGRRRMAYELNKHQKGNYILLIFKSPPSTILELERLCKVTDSIIKYMIIKITKKKQIEAVLSSVAEAEKKPEAVQETQTESAPEVQASEPEKTEETTPAKEENENVQ